MFLKLKNNQKGTTLLELLIYMAILAGFLMVIMNIFFMITGSSAAEEARAEVQQNLRFAVSGIVEETRLAKSINLPVSGESDIMEINTGSSVTRFSVINGVLTKTKDLGLPSESMESITTSNVTVGVSGTPLIFTRIGDTIQINLNISYNDNGRPNYKFSAVSQTTVSLRQ